MYYKYNGVNLNVLQFLLEVLDPTCYQLYDETFITYADEWDEVTVSEGYLFEAVTASNFNIHPNTLELIQPKV